MATQSEPIYLNLSADDPDLGTTEIESMCMNCHKNVSSESSTCFANNCESQFLGNNSAVTDEDSILQRDSVDVILMRTLRT